MAEKLMYFGLFLVLGTLAWGSQEIRNDPNISVLTAGVILICLVVGIVSLLVGNAFSQ